MEELVLSVMMSLSLFDCRHAHTSLCVCVCVRAHAHVFQNEVSLLRNEVAHLKQLLLAHKDCPVTTLQKKAAYLGESDHERRPINHES